MCWASKSPLVRWAGLASLALVLTALSAVLTASAQTPPSVPAAKPAPLPFVGGERLTYELSYLGVVAGTATLAVEDRGAPNGRPQIMVSMQANSSPALSKLYPVENRAESTIDVETFLPSSMTFKRREGKRASDFEYQFKRKEGKVTAIKDGKVEELDIPPDVQDAISCLYYARKVLPMVPGASMAMTVHHDKKNYKVEVRVEGLETIRGAWGKLQAARVLVIMPFQGIFLNEGNVRVWFSADDYKVPLKMKAKVIIGSVLAELKKGFGAAGPS